MHLTNSNQNQQNGPSRQEHSKIAEIYQRMLSGDKSALSKLQNIRISNSSNSHFSNKQIVQPDQNKQYQVVNNGQSIKSQFDNQNQKGSAQQSSQNSSPIRQIEKNVEKVPLSRVTTSNKYNKPQNQEQEKDKDKDKEKDDNENVSQNAKKTNDKKQKEQFRSYIKKKVSQLRNEKQLMRSRQLKELKEIGSDIKINMMNQSKSIDLTYKNFTKINQSQQKRDGKVLKSSQTQQSVKKILKKVVSKTKNLNQSVTNLPKQHNKLSSLKVSNRVLTENYRSNRPKPDSAAQNSDISTPINLVNSQIQLKNWHHHQSSGQLDVNLYKSKQKLPPLIQPTKINSNVFKPTLKIRPFRLTVAEMKMQRQQYAKLNEQQRLSQLDIVQYHQQTKSQLESIKQKYGLNFRKQLFLRKSKNQSITQSIETSSQTANIKNDTEPAIKRQSKKQIIQQKIEESYMEIMSIDQLIKQKQKRDFQIQESLIKNPFYQFLQRQNSQDDEEISEDSEEVEELPSNIYQSSLKVELQPAYSTMMNKTKSKKWPLLQRIQYDTNRSFQEFAKSKVRRSRITTNLSKIQQRQSQQYEETGNNRVTVNSHLKNLLF